MMLSEEQLSKTQIEKWRMVAEKAVQESRKDHWHTFEYLTHVFSEADAAYLHAIGPKQTLALIETALLLSTRVKNRDSAILAAHRRAVDGLKELATLRNRINALEFELSQVTK